MAYPKADAFIPATIYKWEQNCCLVRDDDGNQYIHFYNADRRWYDPEEGWNQYMHKGQLRVMLRVGRNSGPRGRIGFIHHLLLETVAVEQSQQPAVTRSPRDVFKAPEPAYEQATAQLDQLINDMSGSRPKRNRCAMGKPNLPPPVTKRLWEAADKLNTNLSEVSRLCIEEGRTPEALVASRGK